MTDITSSSAPENGAVDTKSDRFFLARAGIWRALIHLCVPMIAAVTVGAIYNIINAGFIGSLHSTVLLSAITFGLPILGLVMAVGGVFGVGGGTYISRLLGEDAKDANTGDLIKRVAAFTFWGSIIAGIIVGAVALLLLGPLVTLLGADHAAFSATAQYVGIQLAFTPVLTATFAIEQVVRSEGAARASMVGLIASTVGNLLFDVLFILVLHWGVAGAALAIGLSNVLALGYYVWFLQTKSENGLSLSLRWFTVRLSIAKEVFGVGVSELLMSGFLIVTSLLLNNFAVEYGDGPLAAFGVALRIVQLPEFLCMGITLGVLSLFAYSFGAGDKARLKSAIRASVMAIAIITFVFSGLVFLFRVPVLTLFSNDPEVLRDGQLILTAQLVATIFNGFTALLIAVFQGTGKMRSATIMSVAQGVLFIPIIIVAHALFGLNGIIWAMTVTEVLTFVTAIVLYRIDKPTKSEPTAEEIAAAEELIAGPQPTAV
jgi:multidrug efflux pump